MPCRHQQGRCAGMLSNPEAHDSSPTSARAPLPGVGDLFLHLLPIRSVHAEIRTSKWVRHWARKSTVLHLLQIRGVDAETRWAQQEHCLSCICSNFEVSTLKLGCATGEPSRSFSSLLARALTSSCGAVCPTSTISSLSKGTGVPTLCSTVWFCTSSCGMVCPAFAVSSSNERIGMSTVCSASFSWSARRFHSSAHLRARVRLHACTYGQSGRHHELPKRHGSTQKMHATKI